MRHHLRWRSGATNPVSLPVAVNATVRIGDLVLLSDAGVQPIEDLPFDGTVYQLLRSRFCGISLSASGRGQGGHVNVARSGSYEFRTACEQLPLGIWLCPQFNNRTKRFERDWLRDSPVRDWGVGKLEQFNAGGRILLSLETKECDISRTVASRQETAAVGGTAT